MENKSEIIIKLALTNWQSNIDRASKLFDSLTNEQLQKQVAENRNTGTYLLGHLTAVHDAMLPLLGIGDTLHPELMKPFIKLPDNAEATKPSIDQLRIYWKEVNDLLNAKLALITANEWLDKHNSVSVEDFTKEPHRNKLSILLSRTNHLAYHFGQVAFLKN